MSAAVLEGEERVNSVSVDGLVSFNRIIWGAISVRSVRSVRRRPTDHQRNFNVMERDEKRKGSIAFICVTRKRECAQNFPCEVDSSFRAG